MADLNSRLSSDDAQDLIDAQRHLYATGDPRAGKLYNYIIQNGYATRGSQGELLPQQFTTDSSGRTPTGQPQGSDTRNVAQRWLDNLVTPDPRRAEWQSPAKSNADLFARSVGETFIPAISHPINTAQSLVKQTGQALADNPGNLQGAVADLMIKPVMQNAMRDYQQGGATQAGLHLGGNVLGAWATGEAGGGLVRGGLKVAPVVGDVLSEAADVPRESAVSGENFTPRQQRAHAAVIAEGNPAGDTHYIPQTISKQSGSLIRDVAGQNPQLVDQIQSGSPVEAYQAHQNILKQTKNVIDQIHERALAPVQNAPVDTASIQDAIRPTRYQLEGIDPSDLRSIAELQARADNVTDLRGLNEFRKTLNTEDSVLRGNPMAQGKSALYPQTVHTMANAVRDAYYDALENVTGQDFTSVKRIEGSIIQQMRGAEGAAPKLSIAEAKDASPTGLRQVGANLIESTGGGSVHLPVAGYLAQKLRGTALAQIQGQLKRFYSDLPASPSVQFPQPRPIAGMLPRGPIAMGAPETPYAPSPTPPIDATTRAQRLGLLLQSPPIELPGAVEQSLPPLDYTTTAQRLGRLLPGKSGAPTLLPYNPEMTAGEKSAALNQWLRTRQQQALPARATPIQLPAPAAEPMPTRPEPPANATLPPRMEVNVPSGTEQLINEAGEKRSQLLSQLGELQKTKPRPINKMFGSRGPTDEQLANWQAANREYNRKVNAIRRQLPDLLEKSNEFVRLHPELYGR